MQMETQLSLHCGRLLTRQDLHTCWLSEKDATINRFGSKIPSQASSFPKYTSKQTYTHIQEEEDAFVAACKSVEGRNHIFLRFHNSFFPFLQKESLC